VERDVFKPQQQEAKGVVQKALDAVATSYREHQGTYASTAVLAASGGAAYARVEGAAIGVILGGIGVVASAGADYLNNTLEKHWPREPRKTSKEPIALIENQPAKLNPQS
jgi:hypothetical protein